GGYVPLDAELPKGRVELMLADAQPRVVLVETGVKEGLGESGVEQVMLEEEYESYGGENLRLEGEEDSERGGEREGKERGGRVADVIYTARWTGRPQGVVIEQRHVV